MCGIIGLYIKKEFENENQLTKMLWLIYQQQKSRGTQGFGLAISNNQGHLERIRTETETGIFGAWNKGIFEKMNKKGTFVLFHHRTPTCTENKPKFNHPFFNEKQNIALIHNGWVSNDEVQYNELIKEGHIFESYIEKEKEFDITDTEIILHRYEEEGEIEHKLKHIYDKCLGMLGIMLIDTEKDRLVIYKQNAPIIQSENENLLIFSSEYHESLNDIEIKQTKEIGYNEYCIIDRKGKIETGKTAEDIKPSYDWKAYSQPYNYSSYGYDNITPRETTRTDYYKERLIFLSKLKEKLMKKLNRKRQTKRKRENRLGELKKIQAEIDEIQAITEEEGDLTCDWCGSETNELNAEDDTGCYVCNKCLEDYKKFHEKRCFECGEPIRDNTKIYVNGKPCCSKCEEKAWESRNQRTLEERFL